MTVYNPNWSAPFTGSSWIGPTGVDAPSSDYGARPGSYEFVTTFNVPANVTSPTLQLSAKADNAIVVYLNGVKIGQHTFLQDCTVELAGNCNWMVPLLLQSRHAQRRREQHSQDRPHRHARRQDYGWNQPPDLNVRKRAAGERHRRTHLDLGSDLPGPSGGRDGVGCGNVPESDGTGLDFQANVFWTPAPPDTPCPAGSFSFTNDASGLHIKYDQFPAPNDNSYGTNAVGWKNGHKFQDLVGSDHAGFQLKDPNGVVKLSFNVDYISANASAPSGYSSLGVTGGEGKMLVGTADGITATTSEANNLNNINIPGLFNAAHVQQFGSVQVLVNSPPTDAAHTTYAISDPTLAGWDFHNTYYVDISPAKLAALGYNAATWTVEPNPDQLHNSPAKDCPPGPGGIAASKYEVKDKQVKITIDNTGSADIFLEALTLNWPAANGALTQIKLDGDVVYNVSTAAGPISLTTAQLVTDPNKRKLNHNASDVYTLIFANNADTNLANYTGTVTFSGTTLTVLPH